MMQHTDQHNGRPERNARDKYIIHSVVLQSLCSGLHTCEEKNVCLEPDLNNDPIIPYAKSILCVTSLIEVRSFDISGFSLVLESRFLQA